MGGVGCDGGGSSLSLTWVVVVASITLVVAVDTGGGVVVVVAIVVIDIGGRWKVEGMRMRDLEKIFKCACLHVFVDMIISAY